MDLWGLSEKLHDSRYSIILLIYIVPMMINNLAGSLEELYCAGHLQKRRIDDFFIPMVFSLGRKLSVINILLRLHYMILLSLLSVYQIAINTTSLAPQAAGDQVQ